MSERRITQLFGLILGAIVSGTLVAERLRVLDAECRGSVCRGGNMRTITAVMLALFGMVLTSVSANAGAWCANYTRGVSNCGYSSAEQCWATVRGLGDGFCAPNPYPGTAYGTGGSWNAPSPSRSDRRSY